MHVESMAAVVKVRWNSALRSSFRSGALFWL